MSAWHIGFDTSNYKSSCALYNSQSGEWRSCGHMLEVAQGSLGIRQSDALFQHVKALPGVVQEAMAGYEGLITSIGYSSRPRAQEGSYMPCFLAGQSAALSLSAVMGIPAYAFSHQQGHLAAAIFSCGRWDLLSGRFLAWHLSGGTTELLLVSPNESGFLSVQIIGGTRDVSAGQVIDRLGVALGLAFPAGQAVDNMAEGVPADERFVLKQQEGYFSLSGLENQFKGRLERGCPPPYAAAFVLDSLADLLLRVTDWAQQYYGLPVVISGGVSASLRLRQAFSNREGVFFASKQLGGDNALGVALLSSEYGRIKCE